MGGEGNAQSRDRYGMCCIGKLIGERRLVIDLADDGLSLVIIGVQLNLIDDSLKQ